MLRIRIRELAQARGLTIEDLAPVTGLLREELRPYWEGEVARPSVAALEALSRGLEVSVGELFDATGPPPLRSLRRVEMLRAHGVEEVELEALGRHIATAADADLVRLNAHRLARDVGIPSRRMLTILAAAVECGIFDLTWELYCLACFDQRPTFPRLQEARSLQTCKNCHATYDAPLDLEIVVTFTVNPMVRRPGADDPAHRRKVEEGFPKVTAHEVMTIQKFRDMFVAEPLPRQESFRVERTALMFTDLGGSTVLYARRGDPQAYGLVRHHFELIFRVVGEEGGAVVKTIGDSVMAAFPASELAFAAACRVQHAMAAFNAERKLEGADALALKVALHAGPCLVVTMNDRLDYFGTTVNVAARLQKLAQPWEVLFSDELHKDIASVTGVQAASMLPETPTIRGLEDRVIGVYRMTFA